MKDKKKVVMIGLIALAIVSITTGVTYAILRFVANGLTENTITMGDIKFHYKEVDGMGRGIGIIDALPVADNDDARENAQAFNFRITGSTSANTEVPYTVTARMDSSSDSILANVINMYLTEVDGNTETPTDLFDNLDQNSNPIYVKYNNLTPYGSLTNYTERVIYTGTAYRNYEKDFRLRMWIDESVNLADGTCSINPSTNTTQKGCEDVGGTW